MTVSASHREIRVGGEIVPLSAGCCCKKDSLDIATFLHSSGLLLLTRTPSFPLYFLEKSHAEISFAAVYSWLSESHLPPVPYCLSEYSISFAVAFALPVSYYRSAFSVVLSVTFIAALRLWCAAVNAVVCFCSYTTRYFPVFSEESVSYHLQHAEEHSRVEMLMYLD